jgi:positive regulator of sigma E activity
MRGTHHVGKVVAVEQDRAVVRLEPGSDCTRGFCCCGACSALTSGPRDVRVPAAGLEMGDRVRVSLPFYAGYLGTFAVFFLPLLLVVAGLLVGNALGEGGGSVDAATLAGGGAGLVLAVAVGWAVNRFLSSAERNQVERLSASTP